MVSVKKGSERIASAATICLLLMIGLGGCDSVFKTDQYRFLSPSDVIHRPDRSAINPILSSVSMADQTQEMPPNATFPQEDDLVYTDRDYMIGPTDVVDVGVLDLFQQGLESVLRREVSTGGTIDLPLLSRLVKCEGLTKDELRDAVTAAYRNDGILKDPVVSVTVVLRHQNVFSVLGSVQRTGTYSIVRKDMRLLEALAAAGGLSQTNLKYLYVIRPAPALKKVDPNAPVTVSAPTSVSLPTLPEIPSDVGSGQTTTVPGGSALTTAPAATSQPASMPVQGVDKTMSDWGKLLPGPTPGSNPARLVPLKTELAQAAPSPSGGGTSSGKGGKWIYSGGRWVEVQATSQSATSSPAAGASAATEPSKSSDPWKWGDLDKSRMVRVIAINIQRLNNGDPRMNIIIRDNDIIQVPMVDSGEFYVMGEVARPGVYSLTNRKITVKMAIAAAGNLGPLAWPENAMLIRRIGDTEEQMIPLNVEAIAQGHEPDLFLKADDVLAVGTSAASTFFLVVKNAFRMTYGFGFIYDRNFADPAPSGMNSMRFQRW